MSNQKQNIDAHGILSSNILKPLRKILHETLPPGDRKTCQTTTASYAKAHYQRVHIPKDHLAPCYYPIENAQKWLTIKGKGGKIHKYPLQTILPKVQMTRFVPLRELPRDVEVDRRRREFAKLNLLELIKEAGLCYHDFHPTLDQYYILSEHAFKHFLPLSFFDNSDYDVRSHQAWLKLGRVPEGNYALPGKAFLPKQKSLIEFSWQNAEISDYDEKLELWTVMSLEDEVMYQVPKIQIMLLAENPYDFVERLKHAVEARNNAEYLMQMETIIDCMMLQDLTEDDYTINEGIELLFTKFRGDKKFLQTLRVEVYLVFEHLMAIYEFERFVVLMPKEFPNLKRSLFRNFLPRTYSSKESKRELRKIKRLNLNIKFLRYTLLKSTLFYTAGGIEAMMNVAVECQYVETLTIFLYNFHKPLPLAEFLQSQVQNSNNVGTYLKNFWPLKISAGICIVLRILGKGWLDIALSIWKIFTMCKISKFIVQVKFRMQESIQVLLERSIINFSNYLTKPCLQFLNLRSDYKWPPNDFINTEFPSKKPIFYLVININEDGKIFYSTDPKEFEPALREVFKKSLEKTSGIRCIDAETLTNLRFAPNLCILTVELIEELYLIHNALMQRCYSQGVIPLLAYAKPFERFVPFHQLNLNDFIAEYTIKNKPSLQVKTDILEYKRQKEELRRILPNGIHIGPFYVNVDILKQFLIKKYIEIVRRIFEYYIDRMYNTNFELLERGQEIYNKIHERPQSIEHLYEIRDFGLTVPDTVEDLRADIQVMWLEYELLDAFFYNLSDHQFAMKWDCYAWPHKILTRLSTLRDEQKIDIEEFRRIHLSEIIGFEERLESLNEEIQAFSLIFDPDKVTETAVDVKKTWKIIEYLQSYGATLQMRQQLFEMDELSLEFLESIIGGFTPYKNLWFSCGDFVKLEEATLGNPLTNLELDEIKGTIDRIQSTLLDCLEVFAEKPEVQNVAEVYLEKVKEFMPIYQCIVWLKNENWLIMHWKELAERAQIDLKYNIALNFSYCMRKGIMNHLDIVEDIENKAASEAAALRRQQEEEAILMEQRRIQSIWRREQRKCRRDIL